MLEYSIDYSENRNAATHLWRKRSDGVRMKIDSGLEHLTELMKGGLQTPNAQQDSSDRQLVEDTLSGIDVHLPFDVSANWATLQCRRPSDIRRVTTLEAPERLHLFGSNLASVYHRLKNSVGPDHWQTTLELVQLGLGHDVRDVVIESVGEGKIRLAVDFGAARPIPAYALADGELTYLAFVGMIRLDKGRTLLAFDEPETHLHPALLSRVVGLLEDAAVNYPVILSTHSDQLLDCLTDPVKSLVVCDLDRDRKTKLKRLSPDQFAIWRNSFSGVGNIRAEGQLESILDQARVG